MALKPATTALQYSQECATACVAIYPSKSKAARTRLAQTASAENGYARTAVTLPKWAFGDPAKIVEQAQNRTCHGCTHAFKIWDKPACSLDKMSGKGMARRCKSYMDKGKPDATR